MPSLSVLIIDDEPALRQILAAVLERAGYAVDQAAGVGEATKKLARGDFDVALCDIRMPDGNGIDLLRETRAAGSETTFVMITASASMESAVDSLRAGAYDFIAKPVRNEELLNRLAQIEAMRGLAVENQNLRRAIRAGRVADFTFKSPCMIEIERLVNKVAPTSSTVLIVGESGSGKGQVARQIHDRSQRSAGPFVSVNCSAIPETLMESEFFGHTRGSFTGADKARKGLFMEAERGTLFLDEIGELPLPMQTKLLHAIEDKQIRAVGSEQSRRVETRIVVATNRELPSMVANGTFREDLYFRLSMFQVALPPLRARRDDLRGFIRFMLNSSRDGTPSTETHIEPEAEDCLLAYEWPGNLRELDNVINRARILAENNLITVADLPDAVVAAGGLSLRSASVGSRESLRAQLHEVEVRIIRGAVATAGGDLKLAAQRLGISLSSLYRKLSDAEWTGTRRAGTTTLGRLIEES
jgi:DNA-binding NtrC family response regulator